MVSFVKENNTSIFFMKMKLIKNKIYLQENVLRKVQCSLNYNRFTMRNVHFVYVNFPWLCILCWLFKCAVDKKNNVSCNDLTSLKLCERKDFFLKVFMHKFIHPLKSDSWAIGTEHYTCRSKTPYHMVFSAGSSHLLRMRMYSVTLSDTRLLISQVSENVWVVT